MTTDFVSRINMMFYRRGFVYANVIFLVWKETGLSLDYFHDTADLVQIRKRQKKINIFCSCPNIGTWGLTEWFDGNENDQQNSSTWWGGVSRKKDKCQSLFPQLALILSVICV